MNFTGSNFQSCGCGNSEMTSGCGCQKSFPTYQQCNQVVQTCNVEDIPHYTNYHTHVVNNCVKRHISIPTYSTSAENVYLDEYVQGQPMVQPTMMQQPYPYMMGPQYQGNVGVEPQGMPMGGMPYPGNTPFGMR